MNNNGYPALTLSHVHSIERQDIRHDNPDGPWICTYLVFLNSEGRELFRVTLYGEHNRPGPEITSRPTRNAHG